MFEHHHEKLLPRRAFIRRLLKYAAVSVALILVSLVVGCGGLPLVGEHVVD